MAKKGYVYLLTNPWIRNPEDFDEPLVKIGSAVDIENRIGTLDTAVPCDFKIEMTVELGDCRGLENAIHNDEAFENLRIEKSEFFRTRQPVASATLVA